MKDGQYLILEKLGQSYWKYVIISAPYRSSSSLASTVDTLKVSQMYRERGTVLDPRKTRMELMELLGEYREGRESLILEKLGWSYREGTNSRAYVISAPYRSKSSLANTAGTLKVISIVEEGRVVDPGEARVELQGIDQFLRVRHLRAVQV